VGGHRLASQAGLSDQAIARKTGLSRNTVRAALRRDESPERAPQARPPSKLERYKVRIPVKPITHSTDKAIINQRHLTA